MGATAFQEYFVATLLIAGLACVPAWATDPVRLALVIPGPPNCVKDDLTIPVMKESGIDPATVAQYCFSELSDVPRLMRRVVDSKPDVLVIFASAVAVRDAHEASPSLPIVFGDVPDPVRNGLAKSLSHPGMNMTGITNNTEELLGKRIEVLKSAFPYVTRLGVLGNPADEGQAAYLRVAQQAASSINIEVQLYAVESRPQLAMAFAAMARDGMQAALVLPDAWFFPHRVAIASLAAKQHLPMIFGNTAYIAAGGLLMYGANLFAMGRKTWADALKILRGANASDLPIEQPTEFDFVVNAKAAREQGLEVSPAAMLSATRVVQ